MASHLGSPTSIYFIAQLSSDARSLSLCLVLTFLGPDVVLFLLKSLGRNLTWKLGCRAQPETSGPPLGPS